MGKESPIDRESKTARKNKRLRSSSSKYLKPGTLAHLRYNKASASKFCTEFGKKRVAVDTKKAEDGNVLMENKVIEESPLMLSPVNFHKQNGLVRTPKTPRPENFESESRLESLPMDLLVSQARQFHFNYTTPDRSRQEVLSTMTPRPTDHWPFMSKGEGKGIMLKSPHTPKAPRHGPRPPSRVKVTELRQIAAVLFQDSAFPSRCMVPSTLPKPLCKSLASNRVLFYEDELCQAVAQNKLR
ncbi:hypothetical protein Golob_022498 [Gossypium lobatum]|uniref:Uncharacterized protein n=1 Tax=Gossypium lobatum TaxID=34289 RepID=A0A7J8LH69_9ROSI|nr:hypothetical protein [Gossypium lobatum]